MSTELDDKVKVIFARMFRRRIPEDSKQTWKWVSTRTVRADNSKAEDVIRTLLESGHKVTAGYTTTAIRNYHDYWILWKSR